MSTAVFFPGSKIKEDLLQSGKKKFEQEIQQNLTIFTVSDPEINYFSGSTQNRLNSFNLASEVGDYLWAVRGGYGTIEILSEVEKKIATLKDKFIVGFSDITALHALFSNHGFSSFHAPMIATRQWVESEGNILKSMRNLFENKTLLPVPVNQDENITGRMVGGNLAVLASLMGTPWQLKLNKGDVLLLEEINEPYYAMARMLKQLSYTPNFYDCCLCWGELKDCGKDFESEQMLINTLIEPYGIRSISGLKVGHGGINYPVKLGGNVKIEANLLYCLDE